MTAKERVTGPVFPCGCMGGEGKEKEEGEEEEEEEEEKKEEGWERRKQPLSLSSPHCSAACWQPDGDGTMANATLALCTRTTKRGLPREHDCLNSQKPNHI